MSTQSTRVNPGGKSAQAAYAGFSASNSSILLDKFNARRATPDSEALASSDDEADAHKMENIITSTPAHKQVRRTSWLNDTQCVPDLRKGSFASSSKSPTNSHPSTPSVESGTWGPHIPVPSAAAVGRGQSNSATFPWGTGIWNEQRKDPPSRLTEVLPSPTSVHRPGLAGSGFYNLDGGIREQAANAPIPFAIPLHPTLKTYRSQSYSVGQLDPDTTIPVTAVPGMPTFSGRGRSSQHTALHHRPSRPSMLSEMSSEGAILGNLKEVEDDDDESTNGSSHGVQLQSLEAKTIEMLAKENAILRQQQLQYQTARPRPRATSNAYGADHHTYGHQGNFLEESDYAIDELDEMNEIQSAAARTFNDRRSSEYGAAHDAKISSYASLENRKVENVKKAYWQSSLGFGGLGDIPQSRRHSFADIPTRQGSVTSMTDTAPNYERALENIHIAEYPGRYADSTDFPLHEHGELTTSSTVPHRHPYFQEASQQHAEESLRIEYSHHRYQAASYFGGNPAVQRSFDMYGQQPYPTSVYQAYAVNSAYGNAQPSPPHRTMYGMSQPRHNQSLYIVLFKCSRADVFYVQEGTGLSVKPGDLVIVEADRGTDLGTVAQGNVEWSSAKELKELYSEEHYKWLMMYSQSAVGNSDGTGAGLMAASNGMQSSTIGGMGPPTQQGMQEPNSAEIKPKMIKRLAQNHEIQALREKEGNEAKAKRVCMQKVKEHGLHMEILDAEFQM